MALLSAVAAAPAQAATLPDTPGYSLPLALQESLYFYDAQKSGPALPMATSRCPGAATRSPSDTCVPLQPMASDVGTNMSAAFIAANKSVLDPDNTGCVNLSGGFHDACDPRAVRPAAVLCRRRWLGTVRVPAGLPGHRHLARTPWTR